MSEDKGHGYDWPDLRERPALDLTVGDTFVSGLGAFTAYTTSRDGRVRPLMGCEPPGGTAWTVTARDGLDVTCRSHDGRERTEEIPERARVLVVVPPEPVGTVLAVNSHRASDRLKRALGREPAAYYDRAMRRGGKFVVLYGDDVDTALAITSVTRTRLKPEDVALCIGSRTTVDDNGLRVTGEDDQPARRDADRAAGQRAAEARADA
ncbi:hypothetical protein ACW7N6_38035 [Streptomyces sp. UC1A3]